MTVTYMTDGAPKSWDKTLRVYEVTYPSDKKSCGKTTLHVMLLLNMMVTTLCITMN